MFSDKFIKVIFAGLKAAHDCCRNLSPALILFILIILTKEYFCDKKIILKMLFVITTMAMLYGAFKPFIEKYEHKRDL